MYVHSIGDSFSESTGRSYDNFIQTDWMSSAFKTAIWVRIQEAMRASGRPDTQVAVAKLLGIKQPSVSEWARGETSPTTENLVTLAMKTNFTFEYLRTGRGERRVQPQKQQDPQLQELMPIWEALTAQSRVALLAHARLLQSAQRPLIEDGHDDNPRPKGQPKARH